MWPIGTWKFFSCAKKEDISIRVIARGIGAKHKTGISNTVSVNSGRKIGSNCGRINAPARLTITDDSIVIPLIFNVELPRESSLNVYFTTNDGKMYINPIIWSAKK